MVFLMSSASFAADSKPRSVKVIAHRGASGYAPENTMASFKKALEMGADMIELDIHLTADGDLAVMHDAETVRTTGVKNVLRMMTMEQIKKLDAGSSMSKEFAGEQVPSLKEVLDWARGKIKVNIEIKSDGCEEKTAALIKDHDMYGDVIVSSFTHEYLKKIKELDPKIKTGALLDDIENEKQIDEIVANCHPDALHPRYLMLNKSIVKKAHKKGLEVNVYTVNDPVSMKRMIDAGADGIITNYPDVLASIVDGKTAEKK
jgi:glycerophosphoryl diester phosphodiesterase